VSPNRLRQSLEHGGGVRHDQAQESDLRQSEEDTDNAASAVDSAIGADRLVGETGDPADDGEQEAHHADCEYGHHDRARIVARLPPAGHKQDGKGEGDDDERRDEDGTGNHGAPCELEADVVLALEQEREPTHQIEDGDGNQPEGDGLAELLGHLGNHRGTPWGEERVALACHTRETRAGYPACMRITVLSGGVGGARFLLGLRALADRERDPITVIGNTADDVWMFGLRICPDLDTVMYTLGDGIDEERGWGRRDETWNAKEELAAYGVEPSWFGLGDRDIATHLVRTQMLNAGYPLSQVTQALCDRWRLGVTLLPMTDDRVETHVVVDDEAAQGGRRAVHFQEYWVRMHAPSAHSVVPVGIEDATPGPGVLAAIEDADILVIPPSNPVVSVGTILGVPGVADAVRRTDAVVVGVSPIIGGAPVRGMADRLLPVIGVEVTAQAVGQHYAARSVGGLIDGWLVDTSDDAAVAPLSASGIAARAVPLYMSSLDATTVLAKATLDLAGELAT
jgi:LPPG:FO 2-phospho-L-lactate transferase